MKYLIFETRESAPQIVDLSPSFVAQNKYFQSVFYMSTLLEEFAQGYTITIDASRNVSFEKIVPAPEALRAELLQKATAYGNSPEVDSISVAGADMVLNYELRGKLRERFSTADPEQMDTIIFGELKITKPIKELLGLLNMVSERAKKNFDNLQKHIENINALSETDFENYDFTTGYEAKIIIA